MRKPTVSVLLPAYNHEKYLKETIESVLNQTFSDFELLISDDCSSDNSVQVIKSFSDERIQGVFFEKNQGTVRSMNHLLELAQGEYIAVLGSDDVWELTKLEKQIRMLEENKNIAACFTKATIINQNSEVIYDSNIFPMQIFDLENREHAYLLKEFFESGNHICHSSVLIRTSVHKEIGAYNIAYRQLHDYDLWVRLLLKYDIIVMDEALVRYRFIQSSGNVSQSTDVNNFRMYNEAKQIVRYLFENISDDDFKKAFSESVLGKPLETKAQINCAKFWVLKETNWWNYSNTSVALQFLMEHLDTQMLLCLEEEYGMSLQDVYAYTAFGQTADADEIVRIKKERDLYKGQLEALKTSVSWKITKPIRGIKAILRKGKKK